MTDLSLEKLARLFLFEEIKPSPARKNEKIFCIW